MAHYEMTRLRNVTMGDTPGGVRFNDGRVHQVPLRMNDDDTAKPDAFGIDAVSGNDRTRVALYASYSEAKADLQGRKLIGGKWGVL